MLMFLGFVTRSVLAQVNVVYVQQVQDMAIMVRPGLRGTWPQTPPMQA